MIPVADMINHAFGTANTCKWRYSQGQGRFEINAVTDLATDASDSLSITYGRSKGNAELFSIYGFVMDMPVDGPESAQAFYDKYAAHDIAAYVELQLYPGSDTATDARKAELMRLHTAELSHWCKATYYSIPPPRPRAPSLLAVCFTPTASRGADATRAMLGAARFMAATAAEVEALLHGCSVVEGEGQKCVLDFRDVALLSPATEQAASILVRRALEAARAAFDTTVDEDRALLRQACGPHPCLRPHSNARNAVVMRCQEKIVLAAIEGMLTS